MRSSLIEFSPQVGERPVGAPEIALDRADADPELGSDVALGHPVDAVAAKDGGGSFAERAERLFDSRKMLACSDAPLKIRGRGNILGKAGLDLRPSMIALPGLPL